MDYKFKISVIMAVYNVEPFLREAIDSVIDQTIGFENIQLILVDDGSPDNCPAICDEYAAKYPDNIVVIHKENGGVSSARNEGLKHIEGRFVNFLDSDDKLGKRTIKRIYNFFMKHLDQVDVVAFPLRFFDGEKGEHRLNYKFDRGSRVIDLDSEWRNPQLSMSSTFIKAECLEGLEFDSRLAFAEDAQLVQKILSNRCALGVVHNANYWYRRRSDGQDSAIQTSGANPKWYLPYMEHFQLETIRYYKEKFGYVPLFIQYTLMYDLQWRFKVSKISEDVLSNEEKEEYFRLMKAILVDIDDMVIMAQRSIFREHKNFICGIKNDEPCSVIKRAGDVVMRYNSGALFKISENPAKFEFIRFNGNKAHIEGSVFMFCHIENVEIYLEVNGKKYPCEVGVTKEKALSLDNEVQFAHSFSATVPLDKEKATKVRIILRAYDTDIVMRKVRYGNFFPLTLKYKEDYAVEDGWVIRRASNGIKLAPVKKTDVAKLEKKYCKEITEVNGKRLSLKIILMRKLADFMLKHKKKPLWLVSDRIIKAGDNGEAFFRYMRENHKEIRTLFVLSKNSPDYYKMKKIGKVIEPGSFAHCLLSVVCDYIVSSQAEVEVYNPFRNMNNAFQNMSYSNKFVFLQHGVIKDDLSDWLERRKKNLTGFVTAAKPEHESIVNGDYDYAEEQIWGTGLPRFDRLYNAEEKQITIMPTWRKYLMGSWDPDKGEWTISNSFVRSDFFNFYNNLINSPELMEAAEKYGYKIAFCPHPNLHPHLGLFGKNPQVQFLGTEVEYRDIYAKSELVVTDYSSAVFDFAYMRKPIVYTHFDAEEFFAGDHVYTKGYFEYERDGFGEVVYDLDSTVKCIVEYMENGCKLKDKYRERVDSFFIHNDKNNCQRVYEKIIALENKD